MKKVLLTSTALVMTAGIASAEMSMSASAKLTYGNFGTGDFRSNGAAGATAPDATWTSEYYKCFIQFLAGHVHP